MTFLTTLKTSNFFFVRFLRFFKFFIRFFLFSGKFFVFKRSFPIRFLFFENLRGWSWHRNAILSTKRT